MASEVFVCQVCSHLLSSPVERAAVLPARRYRDADEISYLPTMANGTWAVDTQPRTSFADNTSKGSIGCLVLHPDDGIGLELHPEAFRNSGCCGHDGLDGVNRRCSHCHADVATLVDDCWTVVELRFEPSAVRVTPAQ
ncbi:MAG: hypothetical protein ABIR39_14440 [Nocardioides sp.]|uniref:hypothetical protein n=1 Tax=Nocardioides sp. TaxID=35761 RepID=UPI003265D4A2